MHVLYLIWAGPLFIDEPDLVLSRCRGKGQYTEATKTICEASEEYETLKLLSRGWCAYILQWLLFSSQCALVYAGRVPEELLPPLTWSPSSAAGRAPVSMVFNSGKMVETLVWASRWGTRGRGHVVQMGGRGSLEGWNISLWNCLNP